MNRRKLFSALAVTSLLTTVAMAQTPKPAAPKPATPTVAIPKATVAPTVTDTTKKAMPAKKAMKHKKRGMKPDSAAKKPS